MEPGIMLLHGKIPKDRLGAITQIFDANSFMEVFAALQWVPDQVLYRVILPAQIGTGGAVQYEPIPGAVMDLHSHARNKAFFSSQDNRDDQGFQLHGVYSELPEPTWLFRIGIYGYFADLEMEDIFE
jgi:hypothetical protein